MQLNLFGPSPKTSPDGSQPRTTPSDATWERLWERIPHSRHPQEGGGEVRVLSMDRSSARRGESSTLRASCRREDGAFLWSRQGWVVGEIPSACFSRPKPRLSDILEKGPVEDRYFLSAKAAEGILRRAERRGKDLPETLRRALEAVVAKGD